MGKNADRHGFEKAETSFSAYTIIKMERWI